MPKKLVSKKFRAFPIVQNKFGSKKYEENPQKSKKKFQKPASLAHVDVSSIKCKAKRMDVFFRRKKEMQRLKRQTKKLAEEDPDADKKSIENPKTIDDMRELSDDFIFEEDEELLNEEKFDEFSSYFSSQSEPKVLMTTSEKASRQHYDFLKEVKTIFPNCYYYPRRTFTLKEIAEYSNNRGFTDVMIWRENRKKVEELVMMHLPKGPTAIFKVSNVKLNEDIHHHGNPTDHFPELILNNFNTNVGRRVGRFFASLFPQKPDFKARTVVTFHNQRDFIFFRRHRYAFEKDYDKVNLQEIGPRFTLKLKKLQMGVFDNKTGEIEFNSKPDMYVSRKKMYL